jgi:hypothetical protein
MHCNDALSYWQQELLGQPVDREKLKEAYAHISACHELCASVLGASPDDDLLPTPEEQSRQTDLYEALGLSAEEEGDAHARRWTRLRRLAAAGKASQDALDHERALALAAWQSAANYYQDGLRVGTTAFLTEGVRRIRRKRLEPTASSGRFTKTDPRSRASRVPGRRKSTLPNGLAPPGSYVHPKLPHEAWPRLALVSHGSTHPVTVSQQPAGWRTHTLSGDLRLLSREHPTPYASSPSDALEPPDHFALGQPAVAGSLDPFDVALWAWAAETWRLDLLVRAESPSRPWTSIMLTLEDAQQGVSKPTLLEFGQRDPQMSGWWARLQEVETRDYHLHLSANDSQGQASGKATLDLHLGSSEE